MIQSFTICNGSIIEGVQAWACLISKYFHIKEYKLKPKDILLWHPDILQSYSMLAQLSCKLLRKIEICVIILNSELEDQTPILQTCIMFAMKPCTHE